MTAPLANAKSILREQVRERLKTIPAAEHAISSAQLCVRLAAEKFFADAKAILFFAPLPDEPDIWPLLSGALTKGKTVALPRFDSARGGYLAGEIKNPERDIRPGQFDIREPNESCAKVELKQLDLVLVPGVAFDLQGHRLGRGKGFYDQLLKLVRGTTVGVAFDEQIVSAVPVEPHDFCLNCILTPTRWQWVTPRRAA